MIPKKAFRQAADPVMDWIDNYLNQVHEYPVKAQVKPGEIYRQIPAAAPLQGEGMEEIMDDFQQIILPGITHWQHPNFHAYFPANSSVESVLAECMTAAIGAQCMIWETSPAAAELEQRMMEWLRDAMGLPAYLEGVIQDTASTATLTALLCARERSTGYRSNDEGVPNGLRVYCSTETHSSVEKAMGICGMGRKNLVKIPVDEEQRLRPDLLEQAILDDRAKGLTPCAVVATLGTTSTVAVDPLKEIARICREAGTWLHVDAAFAGSALLLPEYRWMAEGVEEADSFVFNPHKWLFTNFDCSVYFVRDVQALIHTFEILPEYLKTSTRGQVNDYRDWGIPLGRRFRSLKLWFVLRSFGLEGLQERLRQHIRLNGMFCESLVGKGEFRLLTPPFLNFNCFQHVPEGSFEAETLNRINEELLQCINARGKIFLTHTRVRGAYALRMIIGQTYVEESHVQLALKEIRTCASSLKP